jgi:hypothetical protein
MVMTARVLEALDQPAELDPQQECETYVQRAVYEPNGWKDEQEFREAARQSCLGIISDVGLLNEDK